MTPEALGDLLQTFVTESVRHAVMIWGPPGVGKSAVVAAVARAQGLEFIDVRLSQLAPTDLRGLPVPKNGTSRWFPPEFLPRGGNGILFLDELNMAPPTMQGVAQQLILDRKVGSYELPDGWLVWAAGNRKEDRASVHDMPAPLANRFLHLEVAPDLDSFRRYATNKGLDERIGAFLAFRPQLLHDLDSKRPAWPSPRSWEMANSLLRAETDIAPAVGDAAAGEFEAFCEVYGRLPELDLILNGDAAKNTAVAWPDEPSARYAMTLSLAQRASEAERALHGFHWLSTRATPEWVQLYAADVSWRLRSLGRLGVLASISKREPEFSRFVSEYAGLSGHGAPAS
jgi:MoxR-like ATPase